jgi:hypothetical protein
MVGFGSSWGIQPGLDKICLRRFRRRQRPTGPVVLWKVSGRSASRLGLGTKRTCLGGTGAGSGVTTLRAGAASGAMDAMWRLLRMTESCWRTSTSLSMRGGRGELLDGLLRAWMMSLAPAMMRSTDEARGMVTLDGNQVRVSRKCALGGCPTSRCNVAAVGAEGWASVSAVGGMR